MASQSFSIYVCQYYRIRNRLLWGWKNLRGLWAAAFWFHVLVRRLLKYVLLVISGRRSKGSAMILGVRDFILGNYGMRTEDTSASRSD